MFAPSAPQVANDPQYRKRWRKPKLRPEFFCSDADGNLIVVSHCNVNTYDSRTGRFLRRIGPFKVTPNSVVVDYKGVFYIAVHRTLYIACLPWVKFGFTILSLALRKDHLVLYVAHYDGVMEVSTSTGTVQREHYPHCSPLEIAVLSTNEIVILCRFHALLLFDPLFGYKGRIDLMTVHMECQISVDANNYVYVSSCNNYIDVFDLRRFSYVGKIGFHGTGPGQFSSFPRAMTVLPSGALVVGAMQKRTVQFFR